MMQSLLWIAVGGAAGAVSRFMAGYLMHSVYKGHFPAGTLLVNVIGSLCIGILFVIITERLPSGEQWRNIAMVGFLGAFTTFSTFSLETVELLEKGDYSLALAYIGSSLLLCLAATWGGLSLARHW
jgi:CrcB protein